MKSLKDKFMKYFDITVLSAKHILLNVIVVVALLVGASSLVASLVGDLPPMNNFVILLTMITLAVCFYVANWKKKVEEASLLLCLLVALFFLPVMYFTGGGISSGMPLWLALGVLFTFLMIESKLCAVLVVLEFLIDTACMTIEFYYPQTVITYVSKSSTYFDIGQSMVSVCLCVGLVLRFQSFIYDKQLSVNEDQKKQLIELNREAEESKKEAEVANKAKSGFLANMSHEIRTPINAVLGMDEMILRECKDVNILEYAQNIENSGRALLSLINDILDFSKIEAGKMELVTADYELGSLLHDCYNMVHIRAEDKNLKFILENDPMLPKILYGDEVRLRQIFVNLLTNAVKYTNEGSVTFSIKGEKINENKLMLIVSVKDTGIGISEENQKLLFQSFQRLEEKRNRSIEGTGLGLTIVKRLIDLMDAEMELHSVYGEGSEFIVKIPQIVIDWQEMGDFTERYSRVYASRKTYNHNFVAPDARVLVVDDVEINLQVVRNLLKNTKARIDTAGSGEECLKLVEKNKYDIIFMDHMMPYMDGVETMERMKLPQYERNMNTPVIMLTANAILGVREQYLQAGFCDYLSKPMTGMDLENMLLKYLPEELIIEAGMEETEEEGTEDVSLKVENSAGRQTDPHESGQSEALESEQVQTRMIRRLKQRIKEIDIPLGIEHCGDSEELYLEILKDYAEGETLETVENLYQSEKWEDYIVQVHALKSTSLTVGLPVLSERFKELELSAREKNYDFLHENHDAVMNEYRQVLSDLRDALEMD